jgi:uncharacterized protein YdaU (DUF1376 family)
VASGDTIQAPFPLFIDDFDRDTAHLSLAEQMIYMRALAYVWKHGFIPSDSYQFARLTAANVSRKWREPVANVSRMMVKHANVPDSFTQKRVADDREKYLQNRQKERLKKRQQRAMSPGTSKYVPRDPPTSPSPSPSPSPKKETPEPTRSAGDSFADSESQNVPPARLRDGDGSAAPKSRTPTPTEPPEPDPDDIPFNEADP